MTDAEFVFRQDCRTKKNIARNAKYRKGTAGKRGCSLPSDRMTKRELNRMNGEVKQYNLREPMLWDEFKAMPENLRDEYVAWLSDRFHCTKRNIATMLGVSYSALWTICKVPFQGGRSMNENEKMAWELFVGGHKTTSPAREEEAQDVPETRSVEPVQEIVKAETVDTEKKNAVATEFSVRFDGSLDMSSIMTTLRTLIGESANGSLTVTYTANAPTAGK